MRDTLISPEAIKAYNEKQFDNRDIMEDGSVSAKQGEWTIACLIDGRFQGLTMALLSEREHDSNVFPLEVQDVKGASRIAEAFDTMQKRLMAAQNDPSQTPTADEVAQVYEDMYFLLTPMTGANRYLRQLIDRGMSVLRLPEITVPRRAFDGEALSDQQLAAYNAVRFTNYDMLKTGLELSKFSSQPVMDLVHKNCSGGAVIFGDGNEFEFARERSPVKEGLTDEETQRIALRFRGTQAVIETAVKNRGAPPSKAWVGAAFTDYHNMLTTDSVQNRYQRTLIEKALDAMKLDDSLLDARSAAQFAEDERRIAAQTSENQGRAV